MKNIYVKLDPRFVSGVYSAKYGRRKILISLSIVHIALGVIPTHAAIRQGFNDVSRPGERFVGSDVPVVFEEVAK